MNRRRVSTIAAQFVVVVLGLGVLAWVWKQSEPHEHPMTTKVWLDQLHARDGDDRKQALQELGSAGADDVNAVLPALTAACGDRDASVRNEAALALGRCVAAALKVRGTALAERARDSAGFLAAVLERDQDAGVRASAAFASAGVLLAAKNAGIMPDRSKADDPIDPRNLAKAFNAAIKRDPAARLSLLVPYETLGPHDQPPPEVLFSAIDDPSPIVRAEALLVISQFTRGVDAAVPALLKEAESIDPRSPTSTFGLRPPLRLAAERLHPTTAAVPLLVKGLESQNSDVRTIAVLLFGRLGPAARPAAPALIAAAKALIRSSEGSTKLSEDRFFADLCSALVRVLPADQAVEILREAASPDHYAIQGDAMWALGKLGPSGAAAIPTLLEVLESSGKPATAPVPRSVASPALAALGRIAPGARLSPARVHEIIEAISRALDSRDEYARSEAAEALGAFGHRAACALPRLRALKESDKESQFARNAASHAIEQIEKDAESGP